MKKLAVAFLFCAAAFGQSKTISGSRVIEGDLSVAGITSTIQFVVTLPSTCAVGRIAIRIGDNTIHRCSGLDVWTQISDGTGGAIWGTITGTLTDQSDLGTALSGKAALVHGHAIGDITGLLTSLNAKEATANKGTANGYASLGADGKVPSGQLPASSSAAWGDITGTLANQLDLIAALTGKEAANANIQSHIAAILNPHSTTKAQVGLGTVTDNAQLKIASNFADLANVGIARMNLGLGDSAVRNVGTIAGTVAHGDHIHTSLYAALAHQHAAADTTSGIFAVARLGSGTPDVNVFLRGDGVWAAPPGSGGGEANTASNEGTVGVGIFKQKTSVNLEFYKIYSANNRLIASLNGTDRIDLTINEGNFVHQNLSGAGSNTHTQIDSHLAATNNPHGTTVAQVGAVADPAANGLMARTAANVSTARTIASSGSGLAINDGNGVAGNPTISLTNDLASLESLPSTGLATRTASDTWAQRTITGTAAEVTVTNGNGVSGNPTISLPTGIDAAKIGGGGVSTAEFNYLATVTSDVQTQIDAKIAGVGILNNGTLVGTRPSVSFIPGTGIASPITMADDAGNDRVNVTFNADTAVLATRSAITDGTVSPPTLIGDSGSGGTKGLAPAPATGDAAAGKYLKADGTWASPVPAAPCVKYTTPYTELITNGQSHDKTLVTLAANQTITGIRVKHTIAFDTPKWARSCTSLTLCATLTSVAVATNVGTVTTAAVHGLLAGQTITFSGATVDTDLNGTYVIQTVPTTSTLTIATLNVADATYDESTLLGSTGLVISIGSTSPYNNYSLPFNVSQTVGNAAAQWDGGFFAATAASHAVTARVGMIGTPSAAVLGNGTTTTLAAGNLEIHLCTVTLP